MNLNKIFRIILFTLVIWEVPYFLKAQMVCASVEIIATEGKHVDFVFDSFSKYIGGLNFHGVANVNIKVDDQIPPNPDCKWMLSMTVENNPSSGTSADEWEQLVNYGASIASIAKIEILEVRVTNGCFTSPINGTYQHFNQTGDFIEIIENTGIRINAGSCTTNVNGPGNYLMNYDEFHFQIDFRIVPGFSFNPGIYQLQVKFELVEVP